MSPALIAAIIALVEAAIQEAPAVIADLQSIFANPSPTPADWEALRQKVLAKSYADYVPASALTASVPQAEMAAVTTPAPASNAPVAAPSVPQAQVSQATPAPTPYLADGSKNPLFEE